MSNEGCRYCDYQLGDGKYLCDPSDPNVCEVCQKLVEQDIKIKETRMTLASLVNEHYKLKEQANHNHGRFIHRLPPEIAGYIFELCIEDAMESNLQQLPLNAIRAPFIISAVCRRWRTISLSTPQLWNTLLLYFPSSGVSPGPFVLQEWIDRAGLLPLSIGICARVDRVYGTSIKETIDVLNRYADRWLQLKYEGRSAFLSYLSKDEALPQLRTLYLNTEKPDYRSYRHKLNLCPSRLNKLSITGPSLAVANFDWSHLTQLEMGDVPLSESLEALRRAPLLTHCIVQWSHDAGRHEEAYPLPQDPIVHPNIRYLEFIQTRVYRQDEQVFQYLMCPSLTTLVLKFARDMVRMPLILEFLKNSGCSLEALLLENANLFGPGITSLCQEIPTLQHLNISFSHSLGVPSFFALLAEFHVVVGRKEPRYLPSLRSLTVDADTISDWTLLPKIFGTPTGHHPTILERHRHTLEFVAIYVAKRRNSDLVSEIDQETQEKLVHLEEAGVKWKIQYRENQEVIF